MVAQIDRPYAATGIPNVRVRLLSYLFEGRPLTTKGRWVNTFVERWMRRGVTSYRPSPDRPIFIVGLGRSGTTMLGSVLSIHPDVAWLNEPKLMWHVIHPGEDIIGNYSDGEAVVRLSSVDASPEVVKRAHNLATRYLASVGRTRMVDKYPELIFRLDFVRAIYPDAHFLVLQRRADAVGSSIITWNESNRIDADDWWGRNGRKWRLLCQQLVAEDPELDKLVSCQPDDNSALTLAIIEWLLAAEEAIKVQDDDDVTLVRYEDFVDDPVRVLGEICVRAGLSRSEVMEQYVRKIARPGRKAGSLNGKVPAPLLERVRRAEASLGY